MYVYNDLSLKCCASCHPCLVMSLSITYFVQMQFFFVALGSVSMPKCYVEEK